MPRLKDQDKIRQREKQAYDYYIAKGYTPAQASGIVGNLVWESNLNTSIEGDKELKDKAYGIAQWRGDRVKQFKKLYGKNVHEASFEEQLAFVDWELKNTHKDAYNSLLKADTPERAGQVISDSYEIPQKKYHENSGRRQAVNNVYKSYADPNYTFSDNMTVQQAGDMVRNTLTNMQASENEKYLPQTNYENIPTLGRGNAPTESDSPEKDEQQTDDVYKKSLETKMQLYNLVQDSFQQQERELQTFYNQQAQQGQPRQPELIDPYAEFLSQPPQYFQNGGKIPVSPNGVYDYPQQQVLVPTTGQITMNRVPYPILGTSMETGQTQLMQPGGEYFFPKTQFVLEQPLRQK